ncbi:VOC family protein [Caproiciproducens sp. LBM24188]|nr:glyoxalase [Oscillospiraceae bacterium]
MKISHVALFTTDLEIIRNFYETYFGAVAGPKYQNIKTGLETYFLSFGDNTRLEIMTQPLLQEERQSAPHTGWAHLAFQVGSKEKVNELTEQLACDGYQILSAPRVTGDGYYESCVADPDGNRVEIVE